MARNAGGAAEIQARVKELAAAAERNAARDRCGTDAAMSDLLGAFVILARQNGSPDPVALMARMAPHATAGIDFLFVGGLPPKTGRAI